MPTMTAREKSAMRIMGFLKNDRIETYGQVVSKLTTIYLGLRGTHSPAAADNTPSLQYT